MIDRFNSLSIEQKIGQLFFIGIAGPVVDNATRELLTSVSPGGVCLFARNIREAAQTRQLLDDITGFLPVTPFLSIDQEGGLVDRFRRITTPMPAASKLETSEDAAQLGTIIGKILRILGFNMDFAPVVDVIDEERSKYSNGLFSRTYGKSAEDVSSFASAFLNSLQERGILGCLKHFPGLGAARVDSHEELPVVDIPQSELNHLDLFPYREIFTSAEVAAVMVAHAIFPQHRLQQTGQNGKLLPSSLSNNFITTLLRDELGFKGLVVTDDLEMGAISNNYGIGEACKMAIVAGVDMLAICADPEKIREGYEAVVDAVDTGTISIDRLDVSIERIARAKLLLPRSIEFDGMRLEQLAAEISDLKSRLNC